MPLKEPLPLQPVVRLNLPGSEPDRAFPPLPPRLPLL
jgi:hypothetical protein